MTISSTALLAFRPGSRRLTLRHTRTLLGAAVFLTVLLITVAASATDRIIINGNGCQVTEEDAVGVILNSDLYLRVDFPDAHWRFGARNLGLKGLNLVDVSLQAAQFTSPQYLLKRAGLTEMFVPYDDRSNTFYDMSFGYDRMDQMDQADLPPQDGALVYFRRGTGGHFVRDSVPKVAVECRETGVAWLCKNGANRVRRRVHEVVVWSVFDAFNYDYIIEYTFKEDGSIRFRNGATGYNLPGATSKPHVHNPLWRISTKLFNRTDNQAFQFEHVEDQNGFIGTDSDQPVLNETALDWNPLQFSSTMIQSATQTNSYGHLMGIEFEPDDRAGTGHFQETFTHHDQYLTNDNPGEDGTGTGTNNWLFTWFSPNSYLINYLNNEPIGATGDGIDYWYLGSTHHEPTDNDNAQGSGSRTGITLIHWAGFDMQPHNLFDYNPVGGPSRCGG